jgi:hypothetical protein
VWPDANSVPWYGFVWFGLPWIVIPLGGAIAKDLTNRKKSSKTEKPIQTRFHDWRFSGGGYTATSPDEKYCLWISGFLSFGDYNSRKPFLAGLSWPEKWKLYREIKREQKIRKEKKNSDVAAIAERNRIQWNSDKSNPYIPKSGVMVNEVYPAFEIRVQPMEVKK